MKSNTNFYRLILSATILFTYAVLAGGSWTTEKLFHYFLIIAGIIFVGYVIVTVILALFANSIDKQVAKYENVHQIGEHITKIEGNTLKIYANNENHSITVCSFGPRKYTEKVFENFDIAHYYFTPTGNAYILESDKKRLLYVSGTIMGSFYNCELVAISMLSNIQTSEVSFRGEGESVYLIAPAYKQMTALYNTNQKLISIPEKPSDVMPFNINVGEKVKGTDTLVFFFFDSSRQAIICSCNDNCKTLLTCDYDKFGIKFEGVNHFGSGANYDVEHHITSDKVSELLFNEPNFKKETVITKRSYSYYQSSDAMFELMYDNKVMASYRLCNYHDESGFSEFSCKKINNVVFDVLKIIGPLYKRVENVNDNLTYNSGVPIYTGVQIINMPFTKKELANLIEGLKE